MLAPFFKKVSEILVIASFFVSIQPLQSYAAIDSLFTKGVHWTLISVLVSGLPTAFAVKETTAKRIEASDFTSTRDRDRENLLALIQDSGDFIASKGERKSAILSATLAAWREAGSNEISKMTDEELIIDFLSSVGTP